MVVGVMGNIYTVLISSIILHIIWELACLYG